MRTKLPCGTVLILGFAAMFTGAATAQEAAPDPAAVSSGFWADWNKTKSSTNFEALSRAADCGCGPTAAGGQSQGNTPVDIAITRPAQAAQFLSKSVASSQDPVSDAALATVINMRVPRDVSQAAAPLVAPEVRARVADFRANLSTGIAGLPGVYLGDQGAGGNQSGQAAGANPNPQAAAGTPGAQAVAGANQSGQAAGGTPGVPADDAHQGGGNPGDPAADGGNLGGQADGVHLGPQTADGGIPGLPGLYLGDQDHGGRPSVPQGYTPVAGGSMGCPAGG
jgi:hypothetical protein